MINERSAVDVDLHTPTEDGAAIGKPNSGELSADRISTNGVVEIDRDLEDNVVAPSPAFCECRADIGEEQLLGIPPEDHRDDDLAELGALGPHLPAKKATTDTLFANLIEQLCWDFGPPVEDVGCGAILDHGEELQLCFRMAQYLGHLTPPWGRLRVRWILSTSRLCYPVQRRGVE